MQNFNAYIYILFLYIATNIKIHILYYELLIATSSMAKQVSKLTKLPNIGKSLEELLLKVEIDTPQKLQEVGTENTFIRIMAVDSEACFSKLCAIEGAIRGIRWHLIDRPRKDKLASSFLWLKKVPTKPMTT